MPDFKRSIRFACVYTLLGFGFPLVVTAQNNDPSPNYVVIGAFAHHKNALHFTEDANKRHYPAQFELNPHRNLYYVFVLTTEDREYAFSEALKLRMETKYFDTWVFCGPLGKSALASGTQSRDFDPVTGQKMQTVQVGQKTATQAGPLTSLSQENPPAPRQTTGNLPGPRRSARTSGRLGTAVPVATLTQATGVEDHGTSSRYPPDDPQLSTPREEFVAVSSNEFSPVSGPPLAPGTESQEENPPRRDLSKKVNTSPLTPEEVAGKDFYFQLYRADNHAWVEGEVDAIDFEHSRKMAAYPANTSVKVTLPRGKLKQVSFVCQVFGYRKQQIEFDPSNPSPDIFLDEKGNLVVPFELVRLQKGDIAIMYNVFFFKDAAVMRPESRYEVNNLLDLLKENPTYKIKIHGHTNGNASGKIIRMDNSENFYSLSGTKEGIGSAKKLSEERALVIRQFLVSSGIPEDRMQIKAWGGKKPIHDKHSVRATENVRVEIEILSD